MNLQLLLSATPDYSKPIENFGDRVSMTFEMLLRGMGTIFFVLILLWFILAVFSKVIHRDQPKVAAPKAPKATSAAPKAQAAPMPVTAPAAQTDDAALVAAITAAIAAYLDQPTTSFRVVSFKRTGKKK